MVATVTDEQLAARALVRDWARNPTSGPGGTAAIRATERDWDTGGGDAWRPVFAAFAGLGIFGVAIPEEAGGAGGSIEDLCAMVEEAAKALVPGPVATTALATLVVTDPELLAALAAGERFAGLALGGDVHIDSETGRASGTLPLVLGAADGALLLVPADGRWLLVDTAGGGAAIEPLRATDFSQPLARVVLTSAPATVIAGPSSRERVEELAATVLAAEAAGVTRWSLDTAVAYAKVREQFGKPIGSFQAVKHLCAEMLCRAEQAEVAAADAARAAAHASEDADSAQFSIAAALAAGSGIAAAKANVKDCIQVLGGIGCTWEHDAHLYLRRAHAIGAFLGGPERWLRRVTALTEAGVRRRLSIDLSDVEDLRPEIAAAVGDVAALPEGQRHAALATAGLQAPHWPPPSPGRSAAARPAWRVRTWWSAGGWRRRSSSTARRNRSNVSCQRPCGANSFGVNCFPSRRQARIWRRCGPGRCGVTAAGC